MKQVIRYAKALFRVVLRHPVTAVVPIPVLPDGRIVLARRRDDGRWGLPGGMVNYGEDLTTAAGRELQEETGLTLERMGRLVGVYSGPERDPRFHSIAIVVEVVAGGEMRVQDTLEIAEVAAFARDGLPPGRLAHDHDRILDDYFAGRAVID